ncbi:MAG: GNAT family N-acetyltransferase, partial [Clostridia bacterium]|nr:GNAT family N-acetyltransferase [Clostridia bacterium]
HSIDTYWTADKVIAATDIFRVILAIEKDDVVGYLDITHKYDENEPYDILVKPEYRRKGYGKAMLAKAIELNKPNGMMLLVDVDNVGAIALYESLGFEKVLGENSITAYLSL